MASGSALDRVLASFRRHTAADGGALDMGAVRELSRSMEHRHLVLVPPWYRTAWRLLLDVPRGDVAGALGRDPGAECRGACAVAGGGGRRLSSWSVSLDAVASPDRGFTDPAQTGMVAEGPGLAVLLACPLPPSGGRPRRWWLNPDELYEASGAAFASQREVVCCGPPGRVWLACAAPDGESSTDELVRRLASWAPDDDGVAAAVRRGCAR